jgi:hypothetical protein
MSGSYVSATDFLQGILGEPVDYEVPGVGVVQLRALTVAEVRQINQKHGGDSTGIMLATVAVGLVQPALTAEQLQQLDQARAGIVADIAERVMQLSGMVETLPAAKGEDLGNAVGGGS